MKNNSFDAISAGDILSDPVEGEIIDFDFKDYVDNLVLLTRLQIGLTRKELADKISVRQAYISKLERDDKVSPKVLKKIFDETGWKA